MSKNARNTNPTTPRFQPNKCRGVSHTPSNERKGKKHTTQQPQYFNRTSVGAYRIRPQMSGNEMITPTNHPPERASSLPWRAYAIRPYTCSDNTLIIQWSNNAILYENTQLITVPERVSSLPWRAYAIRPYTCSDNTLIIQWSNNAVLYENTQPITISERASSPPWWAYAIRLYTCSPISSIVRWLYN